MELTIDQEYCENKTLIGSVISEFKKKPRENVQKFMTVPGIKEVFLTDNRASKLFNPINRRGLEGLGNANGFGQRQNPITVIWLNPNPPYGLVDPDNGKPMINTLLHELGHFKWRQFGKKEQHEPEFYRMIMDAGRDLEIPFVTADMSGRITLDKLLTTVNPLGLKVLDNITLQKLEGTGVEPGPFLGLFPSPNLGGLTLNAATRQPNQFRETLRAALTGGFQKIRAQSLPLNAYRFSMQGGGSVIVSRTDWLDFTPVGEGPILIDNKKYFVWTSAKSYEAALFFDRP